MTHRSIVRRALDKAIMRIAGFRGNPLAVTTGDQRGRIVTDTVVTLPAQNLAPIQDWTSGSATFGQLYYIAGLDPIGSLPLGP